MTLKNVLYLSVSLFLTAGITRPPSNQPPPPPPPAPGGPAEPAGAFGPFVVGGGGRVFSWLWGEEKEKVFWFVLGDTRGGGDREGAKESPGRKTGVRKRRRHRAL